MSPNFSAEGSEKGERSGMVGGPAAAGAARPRSRLARSRLAARIMAMGRKAASSAVVATMPSRTALRSAIAQVASSTPR